MSEKKELIEYECMWQEHTQPRGCNGEKEKNQTLVQDKQQLSFPPSGRRVKDVKLEWVGFVPKGPRLRHPAFQEGRRCQGEASAAEGKGRPGPPPHLGHPHIWANLTKPCRLHWRATWFVSPLPPWDSCTSKTALNGFSSKFRSNRLFPAKTQRGATVLKGLGASAEPPIYPLRRTGRRKIKNKKVC